ncbi:MAG TPA: 3D-(3,5/4)-trihydroxycyclohexane-1,2-dione acylhydrolase (decyclizing) [Candidatus Limnocylindrales bacterium]|nr:3D-(3,5/4)-trihydroxycyclohexane-1,2-dione acylhydrolase (decyclizing) [Candidatus Limnocylindrales bacterium]
MGTVRLTVGQALVRYMARQFVERDGHEQRFIAGVWGIFGHGNVAGLGQALQELGDAESMPYLRPQNEQAMVHMAAAFARHRDRLQTYACTSSVGPGAMNMVTGAAGATVNRIPVLLLPSDYFANRYPDPVLQQIEHPTERDVSANDAFRPVSRFFDRISRPEQLIGSLPEAFRVLTDPAETGAVTLALPEDVQSEAFDWPEGLFERRVWRIRRPPPETRALDDAVRLIASATAPLIVAGGGAIYGGATEELAGLADRFGIPVVETQAGKGALPWDHPMNAGPAGTNGGLAANRLAREADVVLCVGTRMGDFVTASRTAFQHPDVRFIGINVSPGDAHRLRGVAIVADARETLRALDTALSAAGFAGTPPAFRERVTSLKREWDSVVTKLRTLDGRPGDLGQAEVIGLVNDVVGGHATVICAAGSLPADLLRLWRAEDPKAYHVEYGFSCMGYEIAAGLGVALADPGREVVVMVGDGSYLMMNSEIVTAVAEGLKLTIVVLDNHGFQCILALQRMVGVPDFGNELRFRDQVSHQLTGPYVPIDFRAHAASMGALALLACTPDEVRDALGQARAADGVTVIVVPTEPEKRVAGFESWWDVPVAATSEQSGVNDARAAYDEARRGQRVDLH